MTFELFQSEKDQQFYFYLKTTNGKILLQSQAYADRADCIKDIELIQKTSQNPNCFIRKKTSSNKFHFNLHAFEKQLLSSSPLYDNEAEMEEGIKAVVAIAPQAKIESI